MMKNFRELTIWKKSRYLLTDVFKITELFPSNREPELKKQMQDSCVDILANITKGFSSEKNDELPIFLQTSLGAISKLEHHFQKAYDLRFLNNSDYCHLVKETDEIMNMLLSMMSVGKNN